MLLLALRRFWPLAKTARSGARKQCSEKLLPFCAAALITYTKCLFSLIGPFWLKKGARPAGAVQQTTLWETQGVWEGIYGSSD